MAKSAARFSRQTIVLGVIIGFHVLLLIAIKSGLARSAVQIVEDIVAVDLPPPPPEETNEPPPPPPVDMPPPTVPPPLIDLGPDTSPSNAVSNVVVSDTPARQAPIAPPPPKPVEVVPARLDTRRLGDRVRPAYPSASRRLGEEGRVVLLIRVGVDGRVTDAQIDQSSGFPRLDEAAQSHVLRVYRFIPAKSGGQAVETTLRLPITFKLNE